ncbi:hypothetical protein T10_10562 [Trichinella papuae]|uniref:Uncharacterized protein n=1 Tax=Trichinella papuae TaxID=268474 RepID=A0A0V1MG91_9BILA|nr:hypothetical protein T10_10562 [Trichinella papuae]
MNSGLFLMSLLYYFYSTVHLGFIQRSSGNSCAALTSELAASPSMGIFFLDITENAFGFFHNQQLA